jgi:hypothetical protein
MSERMSLLVLVLGSAREARPRNKVEIARLVHAARIRKGRRTYFPKGARRRSVPAEFVFPGHAVTRSGGGSYLILRIGTSRIQAADNCVRLPANEVGKTLLRIKNMISDSVMVGFHGVHSFMMSAQAAMRDGRSPPWPTASRTDQRCRSEFQISTSCAATS